MLTPLSPPRSLVSKLHSLWLQLIYESFFLFLSEKKTITGLFSGFLHRSQKWNFKRIVSPYPAVCSGSLFKSSFQTSHTADNSFSGDICCGSSGQSALRWNSSHVHLMQRLTRSRHPTEWIAVNLQNSSPCSAAFLPWYQHIVGDYNDSLCLIQMWVRMRRLISSSCLTGNCSIRESPEQVYASPLSINTHALAHTHRFIHTHTGCKTSVRPRGYEFSSLFHFHSPVSSFSRLSCSAPSLQSLALFLFQPYCFSSSLHRPPPTFYSVSHSSSLLFFLSLSLSYRARSFSLPQASCVYISVVYFYKCQTVFLPSVYWSTESEGDGEREAGSTTGWRRWWGGSRWQEAE